MAGPDRRRVPFPAHEMVAEIPFLVLLRPDASPQGIARDTMMRTLKIESTEPLEKLVDRIYRNRFPQRVRHRRSTVWRVLCRSWFARYIPTGARVLEVAAGYCEFINNIPAEKKG